MDCQEERKMRIAATCNLVKKVRAWLVLLPSRIGRDNITRRQGMP
jgi:hypothetical protein